MQGVNGIFHSIMASGLQKYPAYGSLQKDIAEPWPVGRLERMFWASRDSFQNNVNKNRGTSSEVS